MSSFYCKYRNWDTAVSGRLALLAYVGERSAAKFELNNNARFT